MVFMKSRRRRAAIFLLLPTMMMVASGCGIKQSRFIPTGQNSAEQVNNDWNQIDTHLFIFGTGSYSDFQAVSFDKATESVTVMIPLPSNLPGASDLKAIP